MVNTILFDESNDSPRLQVIHRIIGADRLTRMKNGCTEWTDRLNFFIAQYLGVSTVASALGAVLSMSIVVNVGLHCDEDEDSIRRFGFDCSIRGQLAGHKQLTKKEFIKNQFVKLSNAFNLNGSCRRISVKDQTDQVRPEMVFEPLL